MKQNYRKIIGIVIVVFFVIPFLLGSIVSFSDREIILGIIMFILFVITFLISFNMLVSKEYLEKAKLENEKRKKVISEKRKYKTNVKLLKEFENKFLYDNKINASVFNQIAEKAKELEIGGVSVESLKSKYSVQLSNWDIDNGIINKVNSSLILNSGETCFFESIKCILYQDKQVTTRVNYGGISGRVKIAKGINYNIGSIGVKSVKSIDSVELGDGVMNITDKRILFNSDTKNLSIPFKSIINIDFYSKNLIISKSSGLPLSFKLYNDTERAFRILRYLISK